MAGDGVAKAGKATVQPGRWAGAAGAQDVPHGDVALISSIRRFPYHQSGKSWTSFAWRCFVDCFIHENGNDNAIVIALWRVHHNIAFDSSNNFVQWIEFL